MANVVNDQWVKIHKLISQRKFTIIGDVNNDYKCGICKNILINAHQAICGCHFCYECINQYVANGAINCPNNTEECELGSLSSIVPNHIKNKLISKLIVRCSNETCSHECQLIEMENHLNSCLNKTVKCPFNDVGCEHDAMVNDKLNDHMLSDIHNHNKILIDLIRNLKNEMRELKDKLEENRLEIEMLKENDRIKNEKIESLKEEIKSIKQENEDMRDQMEIGDRNLWYKFDKTDIEIKNKCEKDELLIEFDEKFDMKMNARICVMKEEWNEKFDEKIEKMREDNEKLDQIERLNKIDKYLNMRDYGQLVWQIGKINEIKSMGSEIFYDKQNPYKMGLQLDNKNDELNIRLCIHPGAFDEDLKWPCQADITIFVAVFNEDTKFSKTETVSCKVEKPKSESDSQTRGDPIKIPHSSLKKSNLFNINSILICFVEFKQKCFK